MAKKRASNAGVTLSTVEIGDSFERHVYDLIKREIDSGRFYINKKCCRIYKKKGYYSAARRKKIILDVSIEVRMPGFKQYSLLFLIECKNYNKPVPVDDIEEFHAKLEQVTGANVKGILASSSSFQEGTRNFAKSKHYGLMRCFESDEFKWDLPRSPSASLDSGLSNLIDVQKGISVESYKSRVFDLYFEFENLLTNSLWEFFWALFKSDPELFESHKAALSPLKAPPKSVPFLDFRNIEEAASSVLRNIGYQGGEVCPDDIFEMEKNVSGLKVVRVEKSEASPRGLLGTINFKRREIEIYEQDADYKPRERFTLVHELGHYFLGHERYMRGERRSTDESDDDVGQMERSDIDRLEWQANQFASCILMPKDAFTECFHHQLQKLDLRDRGYGPLYLDSQPCNLHAFQVVSLMLMSEFKVSRSAVRLRLERLGLLTDARTKFSASRGPKLVAEVLNTSTFGR